MSPDVRDFVLDCPVCQAEKGSNLKPGGELQPLEIPARKWEHVPIDFITGLPTCEDKDTILTVVDKATKMCNFTPCTEIVSARDVARLYWLHEGNCMVFHRSLLATGTRGLQGNSGENSGVF